MSDSPEQTPATPAAPPAATPAAKGRSSRWQERAVVILIVATAIPLVYGWGQEEIARWHFAASRDAKYRGDRASALKQVNQAVAWNPTSFDFRTMQSGQMLSNGDAKGAAEIADRLLQQSREDLNRRASPMNHARLISALNQSAYSHALADTELEIALANVDEALALRETLLAPKNQGYSSMLDTRGYLRYLVAMQRRDAPKEADIGKPVTVTTAQRTTADEASDNGNSSGTAKRNKEDRYHERLAAALDDMETSIAIYKQAVKIERARIEHEARLTIDHAPLQYERRMLDETMAVLLHHRGLINQAIGKVAAAEKDWDRAKQLGYDPANGVW